MRRIVRAALAVAFVVGLVWVGQGVGLIPGSFMTGDVTWAVIGAIVSGVAAIALWVTTRPPR